MKESQEIQKNYNSPIYNQKNYINDMGLSHLIDKSSVPISHKRIANSYMCLKKMYGSCVAFCQITDEEKTLLEKFDFAPLEYSTENQIKEEIEFLKKWSASPDYNTSKCADDILKIRVKELKNIISNRYVFVSNEVYTGFKVLENYFEKISAY